MSKPKNEVICIAETADTIEEKLWCIAAILETMSPEERVGVFWGLDRWCRECGRLGRPCYCCKDD